MLLETPFRHNFVRSIAFALALASLLGFLLAHAAPVQAAGQVMACGSDVELRALLAGGGAVSFNCNGNNSPATIVVSPALVLNTGNTILDGGGKITLSGANNNRLFIVDAGVFGSPLSFTLKHIVLTNGSASDGPGGCMLIGFSSTVLLDDVTVQHCRAEGDGQGGGINNALGALSVINSRVLSNTAHTGGGIRSFYPVTLSNTLLAGNRAIIGTGGGLDVSYGMALITASTFSGNAAGVGGGAVNSGESSQVSISASRIENNRAYYSSGQTQGGGIRNAGELTLTETVISGNKADVGLTGSMGGGLYHVTGRLRLTNGTIQGNRAIHGAGITINSGAAIISGASFLNNLAESGDGGGLRIGGGAVSLGSSTFTGNYAVYGGGGIYSAGTLTITQSTIGSNGAYTGGGGLDNRGSAIVISSTLANNNASGGGVGRGGGIRNSNGTLTLAATTVRANTANYDGGGIYNQATLTLNNSTVSQNTANGGDELDTSYGGGGIFNSGNATLHNSTLSGNTVKKLDGGGLYNFRGMFWAANSTFSGNTAAGWGGGILSNHGHSSLFQVTLSGNSAAAGGGIYNLTIYPTRTVLLQNTIIANSVQGYNCAQFSGSQDVQSYGFNLSDDNSFSEICPSFQSLDLSNANDKLGPLANHGGPTLTHLPLPGSAAIDAIPTGVNTCGLMVNPDQRGRPRPVDGNGDLIAKCDIGAVEYVLGDTTPLLYLPLIRR